jgi:hypothetical protein
MTPGSDCPATDWVTLHLLCVAEVVSLEITRSDGEGLAEQCSKLLDAISVERQFVAPVYTSAVCAEPDVYSGSVGLWIVFGQANQVAIVIAFAVVLGVLLFVVLYEEPTLRRNFGAEYEEYCRNSCGWRRYSAKVASARLASEIDFWSFAVVMASLNEASIRVPAAPVAARSTPRSLRSSA